jgi:uncharacterized protein (TIGR00297 family)
MVKAHLQPPRLRVEKAELFRKAVHVGSGAFALLLAPLGFWGSLAMAVAAVVHNAWLLPRYAKQHLYRRSEIQVGHSRAILLYPVAVLLLILAFRDRLELAAAAWGILAAGDGFAGLAGRLWGRGWGLPWNPQKSWAGFGAFLLAGTLAGAFLLDWNGGSRIEWPEGWVWVFLAATAAAFAESAPGRSEDNLTVSLTAALVLAFLAWPGAVWERLWRQEPQGLWLEAVLLNLLFAGLAWGLRMVDGRGAGAGFLVATALYLGFGFRGWLLLLAFLLLGSLGTRWGYREKQRLGVAEEKGGRRGWVSVLSKGGVPAACGLLAVALHQPEGFAVAVAGALASAAFDTVSSELGPLYGRRAVCLWPPRRVVPGTEGAISFEGTALGLAAAIAVGLLGWGGGLLTFPALWMVVGAALVSNLIESLAGSTLEQNGYLAKGWINLGNCGIGAWLASWAAGQMG